MLNRLKIKWKIKSILVLLNAQQCAEIFDQIKTWRVKHHRSTISITNGKVQAYN